MHKYQILHNDTRQLLESEPPPTKR